jgi:aminoglycoside 3-N-acetyltransferase
MSFLSALPQPFKLWLKARLLAARRTVVRLLLSYDDRGLRRVLQDLGIRPGDSVMLHSAFSRDHGFRGSAETLTNVFLDALGPDGHLLMVSLPYRSSSLQYLQNLKQFDVRRTPSMMGLVSEFFRRRPGVRRSLHPTHPVLVHGPRAAWFVEAHPTCRHPCGPDSPFDRLAAVDGKAVFFNVPFATYTFFHYLEHLVAPRLPFPLYTGEPFDVPVVDEEGRPRTVTTHVFAAEAIRRRRFPVLEDALRRRGHIRERRIGATRIQSVNVRDTIDCVLEMAARGEFFYDLSDLPARQEVDRAA